MPQGISPLGQVRETATATSAPAGDYCEECFEVHGTSAEGHRCTDHGHGFGAYKESEEWEERWGCPEPGCGQGRWYS